MSRRLKNTALAATLLAAGVVGYAVRPFVGLGPSDLFPARAAEQTKSIPPARIMAPRASAATGNGAPHSIRQWRCLGPGGGYFTDSEHEALTQPCAEVNAQVVVWRCVDGGGRAQYSEDKPDRSAMSCSPTETTDLPGWVSVLNSPAFRQWLENQGLDAREDSRSPDVRKVTALVRRYNEELADAFQIRDRYSDWRDVLGSKAFVDWLRTQPAEVKALRSDLTIQNVFKLMELYRGSTSQKEQASGVSSAA